MCRQLPSASSKSRELTETGARLNLSRAKCLLIPASLLNFSSERVIVFLTCSLSALNSVGQSGQIWFTFSEGTVETGPRFRVDWLCETSQ